jgi:hypothetical protein
MTYGGELDVVTRLGRGRSDPEGLPYGSTGRKKPVTKQHVLRVKEMWESTLIETEHLFGFDYIVSMPAEHGRLVPVSILSRTTRMSHLTWLKFIGAQTARECENWPKHHALLQECHVEEGDYVDLP